MRRSGKRGVYPVYDVKGVGAARRYFIVVGDKTKRQRVVGRGEEVEGIFTRLVNSKCMQGKREFL